MKKIILFGLLIASVATLNSCGGSESVKEAITVKLTGHVQAVTMGQAPLVVAVGEYTDNYMSEDIAILVGTGKKIIRVEVYVKNNGKIDFNVSPASFTLDNGKETIEVNSLISLKLDDYTIYDGDIGSTYTKGFLFYEVNADAKVEDYKLNIRNTMNGDTHLASISLKQNDGATEVAENTELSLTEKTIEIEDIVFNGKGTLTINKVIENYVVKGEDEDMEAPYAQNVRVEYTVSVEAGSIYCSTSNFKLKTGLLKNSIFAGTDELESGALKAGEERTGYAVFSVPVGDTDYTFVYSDDSTIKLK